MVNMKAAYVWQIYQLIFLNHQVKESKKYESYRKKNDWLKNCILTATLNTNAYPNLELDDDGWKSMVYLRTAYFCPKYKLKQAIKACSKLSKLECSKRRNFGADSFVAKSQLLMKHLKDAEMSYPLQL